jgi:hypothetical protein
LFEKSSNPTSQDARRMLAGRVHVGHFETCCGFSAMPPRLGQVHAESAFGSAGALDQISKQAPQSLCLAVAIVFDQVRLVLVGQAIETLVNGATAL